MIATRVAPGYGGVTPANTGVSAARLTMIPSAEIAKYRSIAASIEPDDIAPGC
jgi:hypothetical protein